ncbi:hypothetical protein [Ureibacillus sinduriensis]|uniref:Lipoprotein n=1 Tax=Ureibacillus sinduriensis BLB-1 = JCM 15800 TaxID=1384057 RepID=A0A0A3HS37_9BACL|nr:hypothetical protein [Ureibacillus sinduriensis]KGR75214.1 hypothetical protein CD33_13185 [Ureibacillus sinduriensis BLB-1 = JCM 15800]
MGKVRLVLTLSIFLLLIGCSDKEEIDSTAQDSATQIDELKEENQKLKDELEKLKSDYSAHLQQFDSTSRTIMRLINEKQYEQIKTDYNTEFNVGNGEINFKTPTNTNSAGFPIEKAKLPMYIAYFNVQSDSTDIGYYLEDLEKEERLSISFVYDQKGNFQYIYIGDV